MLQYTTEYTRFDNQKEALKFRYQTDALCEWVAHFSRLFKTLCVGSRNEKKGDSMYVTVT